MLSQKTRLASLAALAAFSLSIAACGGGGTGDTATDSSNGGGDTASDLTGEVKVDGSSTVFPISEAMAEEFMKANPGVQVTVGVSGSGGGFKKFCAGETDISNASRPIKQSEIDLCAEGGIEYVELPISFDGLSVVVHPDNDWAECLTVEELKTLWEAAAEGTVTNWNQVRADFPDKELAIYAPGTDSGTYDYFTEAVVGDDGESRGDYTASEDDNVLVQGVSTDEGGFGFFGYAYFENNKDSLKLVAIDSGDGNCVAPSEETIADGSYKPLSRPEFFYVKTTSLDNPAVKAFSEFQLAEENAGLITEVGYVPLPSDLMAKVQERLAAGTTGSIFEGGSPVGVKISDKL